MCHKVCQPRPQAPSRIEQPSPASPSPVSPERAGIQSLRGTGMPQRDTFEGRRADKANKCEQHKMQKLMKKLEKLFEKIQKLMPGASDFVRDMINAIKRERTPEVNDVPDRVRRTPAVTSPR